MDQQDAHSPHDDEAAAIAAVLRFIEESVQHLPSPQASDAWAHAARHESLRKPLRSAYGFRPWNPGDRHINSIQQPEGL